MCTMRHRLHLRHAQHATLPTLRPALEACLVAMMHVHNSYRDVARYVSSTCGALRCNDACARCVTTCMFFLMHVHDGYCGAKTFEQFKVLSADLHVLLFKRSKPGIRAIYIILQQCCEYSMNPGNHMTHVLQHDTPESLILHGLSG